MQLDNQQRFSILSHLNTIKCGLFLRADNPYPRDCRGRELEEAPFPPGVDPRKRGTPRSGSQIFLLLQIAIGARFEFLGALSETWSFGVHIKFLKSSFCMALREIFFI